jgi:hypothetical protein
MPSHRGRLPIVGINCYKYLYAILYMRATRQTTFIEERVSPFTYSFVKKRLIWQAKAEDFVARMCGGRDVAVFDDYDKLLESDLVDAVYLPLPTTLHLRYGFVYRSCYNRRVFCHCFMTFMSVNCAFTCACIISLFCENLG